MKANKKGFTLIETLVALGFIALIAVLLLPSINNLMTISRKEKEASKIIYALESAIESEKIPYENKSYGTFFKNYNGYDIEISRTLYSENLDKIIVKFENYKLEAIEVNNEKNWLYSDWTFGEPCDCKCFSCDNFYNFLFKFKNNW